MASGGAKFKRFWIFSIPAGVLLFDQLTKFWALNGLDDHDIELFWSFRFVLIRNEGTIFGLGGDLGVWFTFLSLGAILLVLFLIFRIIRFPFAPAQKAGYLIGYALLLGGAFGNLADRLFRGSDGFASGSVVDFIDIGPWPVFNIADSAITVGIGFIIWFSIDGISKTVNTEQ